VASCCAGNFQKLSSCSEEPLPTQSVVIWTTENNLLIHR
jgi:hypothetical protein